MARHFQWSAPTLCVTFLLFHCCLVRFVSNFLCRGEGVLASESMSRYGRVLRGGDGVTRCCCHLELVVFGFTPALDGVACTVFVLPTVNARHADSFVIVG